LLSRAFLRRVDAISRTAEAIIGGELTHRVPTRGTGDDLDRLASTLRFPIANVFQRPLPVGDAHNCQAIEPGEHPVNNQCIMCLAHAKKRHLGYWCTIDASEFDGEAYCTGNG
jgi:hypothetical protein